MKRSLLAIIVLIGAFLSNSSAAELPKIARTGEESIDVLLLGYYIWAEPEYIERCAEEGVNIHLSNPTYQRDTDPASYPLDYLKQFHVIVVSGPMEKPWDPAMVGGEIKPGMVDRLLEYSQLGGGLVWTPLGAGYGALSWNESTGHRVDAEALDESLDGPANKTSVSVSGSLRNRLSYYWTTEIRPHPVTEGVQGLFLGIDGEWGWPATIPMRFGDSWKVLVTGMSETRTVVNSTPRGGKARGHSPGTETGSYAGNPEIIAVRPEADERPGRMMVLPIYTTWTWGNYTHPAMKNAFLFNGDGIHPSDGHRFLLNAWRWLAKPAKAAGLGGHPIPKIADNQSERVKLPPIQWEPDVQFERFNGGPTLRGLFGAHSAYGGGKGTVAEWAQAAKEAGLDFLVFTDDLAELSPDDYASLIADCAAVSNDTFLAIPGWGADDVNGVYRFYPGIKSLPFPERLADDGRLSQHVGIALDSGWVSWPIFAGLEKMPYNPWWEYVVSACAPLVYEGTELVDNGVDRWYREVESNNMHLLPISLVHVRSPSDLADAVDQAHLTVFRTEKNEDILIKILRHGFSGQVFPAYLTNGPEIVEWSVQKGGSEPYQPNSARFRLLLKVKGEAGIRQVRIVDAVDGRVYRDWRPDGEKEFTAFVDEQMDRQRVLGLIVTDVNGRTAVAPPVYPQMQANRVWHMSDRLMGLHHVTTWNEDHTKLVSGQGTALGTGYHKGSTGEGAGEFSTGHHSTLKFKGLEGPGVYPPAFKIRPIIRSSQGESFAHFRYNLSLGAHDLTVIDKVGDQRTERGHRFVFDGPVRQMFPSTQADIRVRSWLLRQSYMALSQLMVNEVTFTFKEAVKPSTLVLAHYRGVDTDMDFNFLCIRPDADGDTQAWTFRAGESFRRDTEFDVGGYLYQAPMLAGTMGFVALDAQVQASSQARSHSFLVRKDRLKEFQPGDKLTVRMLRVSRAFEADQGSSEWLQDLIRDYGIGSEPAYQYTVLRGAVKEINYIFDLEADEGGASVEIGKYPLVSTLPLRVNGIREKAVCGEYDLDTLRIRSLPNFEGTVTTSVDPAYQTTRLYIGEWLTWDQDDARISLVQDGEAFLLEAHNPTDNPLTVSLSGAPGFTPLSGYQNTLTLPPHESVKEHIAAADGSVQLVPLLY